jgi:alpha-1,3-fucosyltransferase 10
MTDRDTRPIRIAFPHPRRDGWLPDMSGCSVPVEIVTGPESYGDADAVVVHLPDLLQVGLPPSKRPGQLWVAWSMESRVHFPLVDPARDIDRAFDLWMTYRRDSDVWCPYVPEDLLIALRQRPDPKTETAPLVAFISSSFDRSGRHDYLAALMQHLPVDSYGTVLNTRSLGEDRGVVTKVGMIRRYRFTLAFENAIDEDYVTEKFFEPLRAGSVPVYLGAPNIADFAPSPDSYIDVRDFDGPAGLARHLLRLSRDEDAYAGLHRWRQAPYAAPFLAMMDIASTPAFCRLAARIRTMVASDTADDRH